MGVFLATSIATKHQICLARKAKARGRGRGREEGKEKARERTKMGECRSIYISGVENLNC